MRACLAVLVFAACTSTDLDVRVEHQSATLAQAATMTWVEGSVVLVAAPGSFTFPQPLALRFSLIDADAPDDGTGLPKQLPISTIEMSAFETPAAEVAIDATCQPTYCEAELRVAGPGISVFDVTLTGGSGSESDCFYYALYEEADPTGAAEARHAEVEEAQQDCRQALLD